MEAFIDPLENSWLKFFRVEGDWSAPTETDAEFAWLLSEEKKEAEAS